MTITLSLLSSLNFQKIYSNVYLIGKLWSLDNFTTVLASRNFNCLNIQLAYLGTQMGASAAVHIIVIGKSNMHMVHISAIQIRIFIII